MSKIPHKCDRCGGHLTGGWEGRLHSAVIELNAAGCLGTHLGGGDIDPREHAAVIKCEPQHAVINWGEERQYSLCYKCHIHFIEMMRDFLGMRGLAYQRHEEMADKVNSFIRDQGFLEINRHVFRPELLEFMAAVVNKIEGA